MKIYLLTLSFSFFVVIAGKAQTTANSNPAINNLVHTPGYKTCELNSIPKFEKKGKGKQVLLLIPGLGFDGTVFDDFIEANKNRFTMYVITIPGYGNTSAPPMPDTTISYGELSWNKSLLNGIVKLLEKEKLKNTIVIGHFIQGTQLAVQLALEKPELVKKIIILGGAPKLIAYQQGKLANYPLKQMIKGVDTYYGPVWFKQMEKEFYDNGNFIPGVYSVDSSKASLLWNQVAKVPMPVAVRYSCEYFASDILADLEKLHCPMLVLRPTFEPRFFDNAMSANWIKPQFIESWDIAAGKSRYIMVKDIHGAASFLWKDKPKETYQAIFDFIASINQ